MGCLVAGPPCSPISIRPPPPPLTHVPPPSFCTIEKQDSQKAKQNAIIKKIGQERDLEAQNPISHPPPPSYTVCIHCTVYVYTLLRAPTTVYVLIHTRLNQREGMRGNTSQSWVKNKKMTFIT